MFFRSAQHKRAKMIITKQHRNLVYAYLFKEGVLVAKKDFFAKRHHLISEVSNLEVIVLMRSLKSRSLITENFNWGWYYWYLNNEGINFLRAYLHLPENIVPNTLKKPAREPGTFRDRGSDRDRRSEPRGDRFRPRYDADKRPGAAPGEFAPEFRSGGGAPRTGGFRGGFRSSAPRTAAAAVAAPAPATEAH